MYSCNSFTRVSVSPLLTLAFSSCFWSCGVNADPKSVAFTFDSLQYHNECVIPAIEGQEKPSLNMSINVWMAAEGASDELVDLANHFIAGTLTNYGAKNDNQLSEAVESLVAVSTQQYKDFVAEGLQSYDGDPAAAEHWLSGSFSIDGHPVFNEKGILTYAINSFEYSGGPHGTTSYRYFTCVFNQIDGEEQYVCTPISLGELFNTDSLDQVIVLFERRMAETFGVASAAELRAKGPLFESAEILPTDNFCFDDKKVTFLYNVYEIAPYAAGPISISFAWTELLPFMPADSPLLLVANPDSAE